MVVVEDVVDDVVEVVVEVVASPREKAEKLEVIIETLFSFMVELKLKLEESLIQFDSQLEFKKFQSLHS